MERMLETLDVNISSGRTMRIRHACGTQIRVAAGCAWLTEEGDTDDYVLEANNIRRVKSRGLILVYASGATRLELTPAHDGSHPAVEMGGGYNEYAAGVWIAQLGAVASRMIGGVRAWTGRRFGPAAMRG